MGRDEAVYGDVNTFHPKRWIPSSHPDTLNSEDQVCNLKNNFHPFSIGSFDCAGKNVALLELLLVCAYTVWRTDIKVASGISDREGRLELGWG
jgi:cytochrome P450